MVKVLLEGGAEIGATDMYEISSLHKAASAGHEHVAKVLLEWGAGKRFNRQINLLEFRLEKRIEIPF